MDIKKLAGDYNKKKAEASAAIKKVEELKSKIKELKSAISAIKELVRKNGSLLWSVMNKGFTLNDGIANDILAYEGRAGGPTEKEKLEIKDLRKTVLALDKALTLLGYKRDKFISAGVPEIEQAEYSWVSERLTQLQKDTGLMDKDSLDSQSLIGKETIDKIINMISEKILNPILKQ